MIENNPTNVEAAFEMLLDKIEAKRRADRIATYGNRPSDTRRSRK